MEESQGNKLKKLVLFDFDGTLTERDSMFAFISFVSGQGGLIQSLILLSPYLILTKLGLYSAEKAKKKLLARHFKGMTREFLTQKAQRFCFTILPTIFNEDALAKLAFHRSKGHVVYVVSASLDLWLMPWLDSQGLQGICTEALWENDVFTGEFATPNCNGPEKARRIQAALDLKEYERVFAYGDSKGDREMMAIADKAFYKSF